MRSIDLYTAIRAVDDDILERSENAACERKKKSGWLKWGVMAACLCLVIAGTLDTLNRFDYSFDGGNCAAAPGTIVDGVYYYYVPHSGVWSYEPNGVSQKQLSTYWFEEWAVNEYGIYYQQGMSVYVRDHTTGERRKLYSGSRADCTHIRLELRNDGNIIFVGLNKNNRTQYELLLDGITGELIETVMEPTSYDVLSYSESHKMIGNREVELLAASKDTVLCELTENGVNLLENGMLVYKYEEYWGNALWFKVWQENFVDSERKYAILYPDGETEIVTLPTKYYYGGTTEYLFATNNNCDVLCVEVATGESWILEMDTPGDFHDLATDGNYLYTMAPWTEEQTCWKLEYNDDGQPIRITLMNEDIIATK